MADAPVPSRLSPALERMFGRVREAVLKLSSAPEDQATLRNIGLVIGRVLDLLEEDQAILEAADRLYEAAFALQDTRDKRSRSPDPAGSYVSDSLIRRESWRRAYHCRAGMDDASSDLRSLLDRLKGAQHALIEDAARQPGLPSTAIIRRIADLEKTIAAVLALIEERQGRS